MGWGMQGQPGSSQGRVRGARSRISGLRKVQIAPFGCVISSTMNLEVFLQTMNFEVQMFLNFGATCTVIGDAPVTILGLGYMGNHPEGFLMCPGLIPGASGLIHRDHPHTPVSETKLPSHRIWPPAAAGHCGELVLITRQKKLRACIGRNMQFKPDHVSRWVGV